MSASDRLFVARSRTDVRWVREFLDAVRRQRPGVLVSAEIHDVPEWWEIAKREIAACSVFVFIWSTASMKSGPCLRELAWARRLDKRVVVLRHPEVRWQPVAPMLADADELLSDTGEPESLARALLHLLAAHGGGA